MDKQSLVKLTGSLIGVQISNGDFYKGHLVSVSDSSIILRFLNDRQIIISLESIQFVKVMQ